MAKKAKRKSTKAKVQKVKSVAKEEAAEPKGFFSSLISRINAKWKKKCTEDCCCDCKE